MNNDEAVSMKDVWVRYNGNVVLEDINLTIQQKEVISIVGPNGCGKSTLLKTILGFKEPFRGEVLVFNSNPKKIKKAGIIGYLPQSNKYDDNFPVNVYDVVAMSRYARKSLFEKLNKKDKKLILESLDKVEMTEYIDHHFGSLSGGQKQRVLIARALAIQPKILLLDEPSTGLDVVAQDSFYHLLLAIRDSDDLTIIMVSHDIGSVSTIVDKVACLKRRIHFHGDPQSCISSESFEKVFGKNVYFLHHDEKCDTCRRDK